MTTMMGVAAPGEYIREELEAREWSQRDLAYVMGVPEQAVNMIVSGKRGISADMARLLGDAFDVSAQFFMNLQHMYELSNARVPDPVVSKRGRIQSTYPLREMIKRGWLADGDVEVELARFFETTANEIPHIAHAAMRTPGDGIPPAQLAWLFRVRHLAKSMTVPRYSQSTLAAAVEKLSLLRSAPEECRHVPRILTECGVRLVLVEGLPSGKIDGVCTWLNDKSPIIGLSLRFDRIDNFWFVLRHEIEHVLRRHGVETAIIDSIDETDTSDVNEDERVANAAATDFCVPVRAMDSFVARKAPYFSEKDVCAFAANLGIHPGLVAGQLRKRTGNWKLFSKLLMRVRSHVTESTTLVDGWGVMAEA